MIDIADAPAVNLARHEITGDMPLAGHERAIAVGPQHFGYGCAVVSQKALIGRRSQIGAHMPHTGAVRI